MKFIQKETLKLFFILSKIDVSLLLFTHVFPVLRYLSPRKPVFHALEAPAPALLPLIIYGTIAYR